MNISQLIIYGSIAVLLVCMAGATSFASNTAASEPAMIITDKVIYSTVGSMSQNAVTIAEIDAMNVDPGYYHMMLQPGTSGNFTVTVINKKDVAITVNPKMVATPYTYSYMDESWVAMNPAQKVLEAGEKAQFEIRVSIPEDAKVWNYAATITFMENVSEGDGLYPVFPVSVQLNVDVWVPPQVQILTAYIYDRVEAGKIHDYEIMLRNIGDSEISIDPKVVENVYYPMPAEARPVAMDTVLSMPYYGGYGQAFGKDAITITGPSTIKPGETAVLKVQVKVSADAKGDFSGSIDLNMNDPGIQDYEEMVYLNFHVAVQPEKAYEIPFKVNDNATVIIELSAYTYDAYASNSIADPAFEVKVTGPQGKESTVVQKAVEYAGSVTMGNVSYPVFKASGNNSEYQSYSKRYVETYTVQASAGEWTLSVMPHNTENFEYSISVEPSE